jgi:hypothetical protein
MAADTEVRIKVFVSYSRADKAFANDLVLGLAACGFAPYIDRQDIAAGEDWEKRLSGLIAEADSIVYIVSPKSLASKNCAIELEQALLLRKRILPVVWQPIDDGELTEDIKRLNFVFFSGGGRTFAAGLKDLAEALRSDIDWIREHTRLAELARRWAARDQGVDLLLRGADIDAAVAWQAGKPLAAPAITDDQADFIKASTDARAEAERRANRARAGLLTAVSVAALVFAVLGGVAAWQWQTAARTLSDLQESNELVRDANIKLGAEIWLRTAPSPAGYLVLDKSWYGVATNYSRAIARVTRSGGGHATWMQTSFIIDGGLVHPRYSGEPLLLMYAAQATPVVPTKWQPPDTLPVDAPANPRIDTPSDTLPADAEEDPKILHMERQAEAKRLLRAAPDGGTVTLPVVAPQTPEDTLTALDPDQAQRIITEYEPEPGPEVIRVDFPVLEDGAPSLTASEMVWRTPAQLGGERPFQIWRLNTTPSFGWRAIGEDDIDCQNLGQAAQDRSVAMLGIAIPAAGGPTTKALTLNISQMLDSTTPQQMLYTHSTNRASGGAPVFDLSTGRVFAVHVSSEPDPDRPGYRRGEGYSLRHLLDMARSSIKDPALGALCGR